ncbi:MAG: acetolactate synthase small subunit [Polyangiaceae bacterium]|nr:acetolactate synthase small subunit [Polyangiaceae bacterium]
MISGDGTNGSGTSNGRPLRTFVAYVEDQPGVLNRIASLFRRRGYNIASLNVGRTHEPGTSRLTMVVEADETTACLLEANLYKLVNVISVDDITNLATVVRDLALVKVRAVGNDRADVLQIGELFRARVVDVSDETMTFEMTGTQDKIVDLLARLRPFGIVEMVQTGAIAMTRGAESRASSVAHRPSILPPPP